MTASRTSTATFVVGAVVLTFTSLACGGGNRFQRSMDTYGGVSMVLTGESGCDLDSAKTVLEQRISGYSLVDGVVSLDLQQLHVMVSGQTLDEALANQLVKPYRVEFAPVIDTVEGSPGSTGRWLVSRADPIVHVHVSEPSPLTNTDVVAAHLDDTDYQPVIRVTLSDTGASVFEDLSGELVGQQLAIIVDNSVASAPFINERISGGQVHLTGFEWGEAAWLASALNASPLPCTLTVTELDTIGPTGSL